MEPLVSVIVPTRNSADHLRALLTSLAGSDYRNFEVIVNDDTQTNDDTAAVIEGFRVRGMDISLIRDNRNIGHGRLMGARRARGEYLLHVDSDMQLESGLIAECVRLVGGGEADALVIPEESYGTTFWARCKWLEKKCYEGIDQIESLRFVRAADYRQVGGHDAEMQFSEDKDFDLRIRAAGLRVGRTRNCIRHNEGEMRLWQTMKKKFGYARTAGPFVTSHPGQCKWQANLLHRFVIFARNARYLLSHPLLYAGLFVMKTAEFAAGAAGYVIRRPAKRRTAAESERSILIADSYALNTGDLGILLAMVESIAAELPGIVLRVESSHPAALDDIDELRGITVYPRIFDIQRLVGSPVRRGRAPSTQRLTALLAGAYDSLTFLLWAASVRLGLPGGRLLVRRSRRPQADMMRQVAAVVSCGGGFLSTRYRYGFRLFLYLVAFLLNKPVIVFAQSVGPFETALSRFLIPRFLRRAAVVAVREPDSLQYLTRFGLGDRTVLTADIAFLLRAHADAPGPAAADRRRVAVCVRDSGPDSNYERSVATAVGFLSERGYDVALVSQTAGDDGALDRLAAAAPDGRVTTHRFGLHPKSAKRLYAGCDFVIASRMHAIVFACEAHVPFVSIGYEPKFRGLMEQLGYERALALTDDELTPESLLAAVRLVAERRDELATRLAVSLTEIRKRSALNVRLLARALERA
ncbi:polysaccharide pyruvyl transferase family protein [Patescibacteria group bacterium]